MCLIHSACFINDTNYAIYLEKILIKYKRDFVAVSVT